jgi:membrane-bound lytic murein transglycosylase B
MHPQNKSDLSDELPAWRIVRPAPARTLRAAYDAAEDRFGVDWNYLAAINLVETGLGRIRGTSVAGAQGPMQFIPSTWATYGRGDINSVRDSILAAGRFLEDQGFTEPEGRSEALYRYNNSTAYVRGVTLLAELMERRPRAFDGYYHWQIYYLTTKGSILLPEGYRASKPIPVERWLARHP